VSEKIGRRSVLKGSRVIFPAAVLAGCAIGGNGAYDATVRNGTEERLGVSVQVTEDDSTLIDTTLTLNPAEASEFERSKNTFI